MVKVMDILAFLKRLLGRAPRCRIGAGAVLHPSSRLDNSLEDTDANTIRPNGHIKGELVTFPHGGRRRLGEFSLLGESRRSLPAPEVTIENRVPISQLVTTMDSLTSLLNSRLRHEQFRTIVSLGQPRSIELGEKPIIVGDNVLIGCHSEILRGVRIGTGAIVGAGSVVPRDVPEVSIAGENPAQVIRELSPGERL